MKKYIIEVNFTTQGRACIYANDTQEASKMIQALADEDRGDFTMEQGGNTNITHIGIVESFDDVDDEQAKTNVDEYLLIVSDRE